MVCYGLNELFQEQDIEPETTQEEPTNRTAGASSSRPCIKDNGQKPGT